MISIDPDYLDDSKANYDKATVELQHRLRTRIVIQKARRTRTNIVGRRRGIVDGSKDSITVILDAGAEVDLISEEVARQAGVEIEDLPEYAPFIRAANGSNIALSGIATINVTFQQTPTSESICIKTPWHCRTYHL